MWFPTFPKILFRSKVCTAHPLRMCYFYQIWRGIPWRNLLVRGFPEFQNNVCTQVFTKLIAIANFEYFISKLTKKCHVSASIMILVNQFIKLVKWSGSIWKAKSFCFWAVADMMGGTQIIFWLSVRLEVQWRSQYREKGAECPLDSEKIVKNRGKRGKKETKNRKKRDKNEKSGRPKKGRFFYFAPPDK